MSEIARGTVIKYNGKRLTILDYRSHYGQAEAKISIDGKVIYMPMADLLRGVDKGEMQIVG